MKKNDHNATYQFIPPFFLSFIYIVVDKINEKLKKNKMKRKKN